MEPAASHVRALMGGSVCAENVGTGKAPLLVHLTLSTQCRGCFTIDFKLYPKSLRYPQGFSIFVYMSSLCGVLMHHYNTVLVLITVV